MKITVRVPGSCGELIQGMAGGEPFLGVCPIDRYTTVQISDDFSGLSGLGGKSRQALGLALAKAGKTAFPYGIRLESELPQGKGMASSSADIAAVAAGVFEALNVPWTPAGLLEIAARIEPTDGTFFQGIVVLNQVTGRVLDRFAYVPPLRGAIFDLGGTVDTCTFHQEAGMTVDSLGLLTEFRRAMQAQQAERVAHMATKSAFLNQELLYKQELMQIWQMGQAADACGINAAHSGTVVGVWWLADKDLAEIDGQAEHIAQSTGVDYLGPVNLRSGGVEVKRS